jgi:NAD(P)-dependent dehydrogenase (short-subunit alcohol dehydrogenase family)
VRALAGEGCDVVVADIDEAAAATAAKEVEAVGRRAFAVGVDVADAEAMSRLADAAFEFGGTVEVLCLNAGVLLWGAAHESTIDDWRWILDVNLLGVVNGIRAFLPRLVEQGTPAHIVTTASVAGLRGSPALAAYSASKSAVVSLSESLSAQLADTPIGVTVLCPANIESRILDAQRTRPSTRGVKAPEPMGTAPPGVGIDAAHVAASALDAIRAGELYAFTYPADERDQLRASLEHRSAAILRAVDHGAVQR